MFLNSPFFAFNGTPLKKDVCAHSDPNLTYEFCVFDWFG
jgi:hypothetical protein